MLVDLPTKLLVINEWIFHDLQGENCQTKRAETVRFLEHFEQNQDQLVFVLGSPWAQKVWDLMKHDDIETRAVSKRLGRIINDLNKCLKLQPRSVESAAPHDAIEAAPEEDIYLIQTYFAAGADLLITTDEGLLEAFVCRQDVQVVHRDIFLKDYMTS